MQLTYLKEPRPVTDALRATVVEDLPEIEGIGDANLRSKVIEAWATALAGSSFGRITDIPGAGNPTDFILKRGTQADHLRGVANFAVKMADQFLETFPEIDLNRDVVLAGALCHDVGKAWEFDPVNQKRWGDDPAAVGMPSLRHSVYGVHICLSVGLPEEIAHIALGHSMEGQHIGLSAECTIVRHADHSWWLVAGAAGLLQPDSLKYGGSMLRPRKLRGE